MSDNDENWFIFDSYREMKVQENGQLLVIRPFQKETNVPLFCPKCNFPLKTIEDGIAYRQQFCCNLCMQRWGDKKQIDENEWQEYLKEKELILRPIFIFR